MKVTQNGGIPVRLRAKDVGMLLWTQNFNHHKINVKNVKSHYNQAELNSSSGIISNFKKAKRSTSLFRQKLNNRSLHNSNEQLANALDAINRRKETTYGNLLLQQERSSSKKKGKKSTPRQMDEQEKRLREQLNLPAFNTSIKLSQLPDDVVEENNQIDPPCEEDPGKHTLKRELMRRLDLNDDKVLREYLTLYNSTVSNKMNKRTIAHSDLDQTLINIHIRKSHSRNDTATTFLPELNSSHALNFETHNQAVCEFTPDLAVKNKGGFENLTSRYQSITSHAFVLKTQRKSLGMVTLKDQRTEKIKERLRHHSTINRQYEQTRLKQNQKIIQASQGFSQRQLANNHNKHEVLRLSPISRKMPSGLSARTAELKLHAILYRHAPKASKNPIDSNTSIRASPKITKTLQSSSLAQRLAVVKPTKKDGINHIRIQSNTIRENYADQLNIEIRPLEPSLTMPGRQYADLPLLLPVEGIQHQKQPEKQDQMKDSNLQSSQTASKKSKLLPDLSPSSSSKKAAQIQLKPIELKTAKLSNKQSSLPPDKQSVQSISTNSPSKKAVQQSPALKSFKPLESQRHSKPKDNPNTSSNQSNQPASVNQKIKSTSTYKKQDIKSEVKPILKSNKSDPKTSNPSKPNNPKSKLNLKQNNQNASKSSIPIDNKSIETHVKGQTLGTVESGKSLMMIYQMKTQEDVIHEEPIEKITEQDAYSNQEFVEEEIAVLVLDDKTVADAKRSEKLQVQNLVETDKKTISKLATGRAKQEIAISEHYSGTVEESYKSSFVESEIQSHESKSSRRRAHQNISVGWFEMPIQTNQKQEKIEEAPDRENGKKENYQQPISLQQSKKASSIFSQAQQCSDRSLNKKSMLLEIPRSSQRSYDYKVESVRSNSNSEKYESSSQSIQSDRQNKSNSRYPQKSQSKTLGSNQNQQKMDSDEFQHVEQGVSGVFIEDQNILGPEYQHPMSCKQVTGSVKFRSDQNELQSKPLNKQMTTVQQKATVIIKRDQDALQGSPHMKSSVANTRYDEAKYKQDLAESLLTSSIERTQTKDNEFSIEKLMLAQPIVALGIEIQQSDETDQKFQTIQQTKLESGGKTGSNTKTKKKSEAKKSSESLKRRKSSRRDQIGLEPHVDDKQESIESVSIDVTLTVESKENVSKHLGAISGGEDVQIKSEMEQIQKSVEHNQEVMIVDNTGECLNLEQKILQAEHLVPPLKKQSHHVNFNLNTDEDSNTKRKQTTTEENSSDRRQKKLRQLLEKSGDESSQTSSYSQSGDSSSNSKPSKHHLISSGNSQEDDKSDEDSEESQQISSESEVSSIEGLRRPAASSKESDQNPNLLRSGPQQKTRPRQIESSSEQISSDDLSSSSDQDDDDSDDSESDDYSSGSSSDSNEVKKIVNK